MDPSQPKSPKVELARPKRPLSAYNLYYRFKRQKIVEALALAGGAMDKAAIRRLVEAPPGLENTQSALEFSRTFDELRRERIIRGLEGRTEARDTRARSHRRNPGAMNGGMGFVELASLMKTGWAECDDFAQGVFKGLAEEGRRRYRRVLLEYKIQVERLGLTEEDLEKSKKDKVKKKQAKKRLPAKKREITEISQSSGDDTSADGHGNGEKEAAEFNIIKKKQVKKTPPAKKSEIAQISQLTGGNASAERDGDTEKQAAEIIIQLTNTSPTRGENTSNSLAQQGFDCAVAPASLPDILPKQGTAPFLLRRGVHPPSRRDAPKAQPSGQLDLPSNQEVPGAEGIEGDSRIIADGPCTPPAAFGSSRQNPAQLEPRAMAPPLKPPFQTQAKMVSPTYSPRQDAFGHEREQELMLRVKKMEAQLAEQRIMSRIQELEHEMAMRRVSGGLLRTALGNMISHEGSAAVSGPGALLQGGLAQASLAQTGFHRPILTPPHFAQSDVSQDTTGEASTSRAGMGQCDSSRTGPVRSRSFQGISAQGEEVMPKTAFEDANAQNDAAFPSLQNRVKYPTQATAGREP